MPKTTKKTAATKKAAAKLTRRSKGDLKVKVIKALRALKSTKATAAKPVGDVARKAGIDAYDVRQCVRGSKVGAKDGLVGAGFVAYAEIEGQAGKSIHLTAKGQKTTFKEAIFTNGKS